jgi:hypothetical protein
MKPEMSDADLDALLSDLRSHPPEADARLLARIVDDAQAVQSSRTSVRAVVPTREPALRRWISALGGSVALAGLGTAAMAGLWIGIAQPASLIDVTDQLAAALGREAALDYVELFPDFTTLQIEG